MPDLLSTLVRRHVRDGQDKRPPFRGTQRSHEACRPLGPLPAIPKCSLCEDLMNNIQITPPFIRGVYDPSVWWAYYSLVTDNSVPVVALSCSSGRCAARIERPDVLGTRASVTDCRHAENVGPCPPRWFERAAFKGSTLFALNGRYNTQFKQEKE